MVVAVLAATGGRDWCRAALNRVYNQFYRHQLVY